ncbi:hypothetical protein AVDCRST_MAG92-1277 [uncultured Coleofasciculus sp.]|uniref:Uncharacterized protein n=1 Tax=uncultured Coleofasciculus sp. TaxID=1267456 RepID=A0A6J4HZV7_9CYAN|nr:hypothetical protein AVDCRST_MAG92-1277 [uncultured Coleofasciculus sp.]
MDKSGLEASTSHKGFPCLCLYASAADSKQSIRTGITASPQVTREPDQSFVLQVASQLKSDSFPLDSLRKECLKKQKPLSI